MEREDVEWTRLAQGSDQWWAFVNNVVAVTCTVFICSILLWMCMHCSVDYLLI
jgi:hypothetical protein